MYISQRSIKVAGGKPTLIIVRRRLAEAKAILADVTLVASSARFKVPTAMPSEERTSSRPFGCGDVVDIVEA